MSLWIGLAGQTPNAEERRWLRRPEVSGVVLFRRNLGARDEVVASVGAIRRVRPELLLAVDQEGGPVQRLREGFTRLPALARIGEVHARDPDRGLRLAAWHAQVMACEVLAVGFDLSLAPVADLKRGNRAIGERAFAAEPIRTAELTARYVRAMQRTGMAATLKHFPGHGSVLPDTHHEVATDTRPIERLAAEDLLPFASGVAAGARAVMLAHVRYPAFSERAAGYAPEVITGLRQALGFRGVVMSDDVSMVGAEEAGGVAERVRAHLEAGCDAVLACQPEAVEAALAAERSRLPPRGLARLRARRSERAQAWLGSRAYRARVQALIELGEST